MSLWYNEPEDEGIFDKPKTVSKVEVKPPGILLGNANTEPIYISPETRRRHVYMIGLSGTGKTTLYENMMVQDMEQGNGLAYIDPHGDSSSRVLGLVPKSRVDDVIYFDPMDYSSASFNPLQTQFDAHKVVLDAISVFKLFYGDSWSTYQDNISRNGLLTLLFDDKPHTLVDFKRILVDPEYRSTIKINDPDLELFWEHRFERLPKSSIDSLCNKIDNILMPRSRMLQIFSQRENDLDFWRIMNEGKILICRLPKGDLNSDAAKLLGGFLVAGIQQSALARTSIDEEKRRPFYLYVDEFQNFQVESFDEIMTESRKYKLYLTLAHQRMSQVTERLQDAVTTAGTRIAFQIHDHDATRVKSVMNVSRMVWRKPGRDWEPILSFRDYAIEVLTNASDLKAEHEALLRDAQTAFTPSQLRAVAKSHIDYIDRMTNVKKRLFPFEGIEFQQEEFPEKYELQNLPEFTAFVRLGDNRHVYRIQTLKAPDPDKFIRDYILLKRPAKRPTQPQEPPKPEVRPEPSFSTAEPLDAPKPDKMKTNGRTITAEDISLKALRKKPGRRPKDRPE